MNARTWLTVAALALATTPASAALTPLTDAKQIDVGSASSTFRLPNGSFVYGPVAHGCAVTLSGGVKCWGGNGSGQLGDGSQGPAREHAGPVAGLSTGVTAVAVSTDQSGGHACALLDTGAVKCWGSNFKGQLGDGTTTSSRVPVDVIGLGGPAVAISAGGYHTCAVLSGGTLKCWGENSFGQLGDGTTQLRSTPVDVTGVGTVASVSASAGHTCAVTTGGGLKCWGANSQGQLGDGTTSSRSTPADVSGLTSGVGAVETAGIILSPFTLASVGTGHTCARLDSGGLKCWGGNSQGQLGDGTTTTRLVPFDVSGLTSGVSAVTAGAYHTSCSGCCCGTANPGYASFESCALMPSGSVKAWGISSPSTPADVVGLPGAASAISSAAIANCALLTDGRVACWRPPDSASVKLIQVGTVGQVITVTQDLGLVAIGFGNPLNAMASSGLPLVATSLTPSICSVAVDPSPVYDFAVTGLAQGRCEIALDQPGNGAWDPAPRVVVVARSGDKLSQSITFGTAPALVVQGMGPVAATASTGLPVSFATTTPSICTVAGNIVTGVAVGTCTIVASQAGDDWYAPAPQVTQSFPVAANDGSAYGLLVTKTGSGVVSSTPAGIDCGPMCGANFATGTSVTLAAAPAPGSVFNGWTGACTGVGACTVSMTVQRNVTAAFIPATAIPRLVNISTRARVLTGDNVMIGGFIIGGSLPKTVVVRARGPSLAAAGIQVPLADPILALYSGSTQIATNDNWGDAPNASIIGASVYAPTHAAESVILMQLAPGAYTAIVSGAAGTTGVGIVELFEFDTPDTPLINISTRGQTRGMLQGGEDVLIGGFIIQGNGPQTVVVRARGPSLTPFGVPNALANPVLSVSHGSSSVWANDNWQDHASAAQVQASGFAPSDPLESAMMLTLNPGGYTVLVQGSGSSSGMAIVEVFRVP